MDWRIIFMVWYVIIPFVLNERDGEQWITRRWRATVKLKRKILISRHPWWHGFDDGQKNVETGRRTNRQIACNFCCPFTSIQSLSCNCSLITKCDYHNLRRCSSSSSTVNQFECKSQSMFGIYLDRNDDGSKCTSLLNWSRRAVTNCENGKLLHLQIDWRGKLICLSQREICCRIVVKYVSNTFIQSHPSCFNGKLDQKHRWSALWVNSYANDEISFKSNTWSINNPKRPHGLLQQTDWPPKSIETTSWCVQSDLDWA